MPQAVPGVRPESQGEITGENVDFIAALETQGAKKHTPHTAHGREGRNDDVDGVRNHEGYAPLRPVVGTAACNRGKKGGARKKAAPEVSGNGIPVSLADADNTAGHRKTAENPLLASGLRGREVAEPARIPASKRGEARAVPTGQDPFEGVSPA